MHRLHIGLLIMRSISCDLLIIVNGFFMAFKVCNCRCRIARPEVIVCPFPFVESRTLNQHRDIIFGLRF